MRSVSLQYLAENENVKICNNFLKEKTDMNKLAVIGSGMMGRKYGAYPEYKGDIAA